MIARTLRMIVNARASVVSSPTNRHGATSNKSAHLSFTAQYVVRQQSDGVFILVYSLAPTTHTI